MTETQKFLRYIFPAGSIVELRAILADGTVLSGRFTDLNSMAFTATDFDTWEDMSAIYYTLNPIAPDRAKRIGDWSANVMKSKARSTRDADVACRTLYLVDVDPVRPTGVCSTDGEKAEALNVTSNVHAYLAERGWPEPILVDSGNGYHLLYRGDRCNASSSAWVHVLKHLAGRFNSDGAKVDTSVGNAARISRLPGTFNRKGTHAPDRPHRRASVVSYPEQWEPVNHGTMVYALARSAGYEQEHKHKGSVRQEDRPELVIDDAGVRALIAEYPKILQYSHTIERGGLMMYVLAECPFAGRRHSGDPNKTAVTLSDTALGFRCLSDDCTGKGWRELKELLHDRTGRWPRTRIYDQSVTAEELFEWEVADYYQRMEHTITFRDDWRYDNATWQAIRSGAVAALDLSTDPTEWDLTFADLRDPFYGWAINELHWTQDPAEHDRLQSEYCGIIDRRDIQMIGAMMGKDNLFLIVRDRERPKDLTPERERLPTPAAWKKKRDERVLSALELKQFVEA
jgi:hypothetical protein